MRIIKEIPYSDIDTYIKLACDAYPSFKDLSDEGIASFKKLVEVRFKDETTHYFGMYENDQLIAAMRLFDFKMNFLGQLIDASGLASLAVDLLHKKKGIAKEMVAFYEDYYRKQNIQIAMLLPFKTDYYFNQGYGYGTKLNRYQLQAKDFPKYDDLSTLYRIPKQYIEETFYAYDIYHKQTHGLLNRISDEVYDYLNNDDYIFIGNYVHQIITGYMVFYFENGKDDNYTINNMKIVEMVYLDSITLQKFLGFIRNQSDQVNLVQIDTCNDNFHHLFKNPLNDSQNYYPYGYLETDTQAVGPMYKLLDIKEAFNQVSYRNYNNVNLKVRLSIIDENNITNNTIVHFVDGKALLDQDNYDVTVTLSINHFSSLFVGATNVNDLYQLGLLSLDNISYLDSIHLAFIVKQKPYVNTDF